MKRRLLAAHRWVGLVTALFWAVQAVTGLVLVFHAEIDNALTPGASAPLDPSKLGSALTRLSVEAGTPVISITAADRGGKRYDVFTVDDEHRYVRVTGVGEVVAVEDGLGAARFFDALKMFHESLWAGDAGLFIVGLSGFLLLSNLLLGLRLAWPAAGRLRQVLWPSGGQTPAATAFLRHRAVGLALVAPALVLVFAGFGMIVVDPFAQQLGVSRSAPEPPRLAAPVTLRFEQAVGLAVARYPGARVSVVNLPSAERPWFRLRLRQPGELQRFYGGTELYVDARTGRVLADYDAHRAPAARKAVDALFPLHTMESLGRVGQALAVAVGLWLLITIALGLGLWRARHRLRAGRRA